MLWGNTLCHVSIINSEPITQYFVPKNARYSLLKEYHDGQSHIGLDKTLDRLLSHFWFPKMRQFIKRYIDHCLARPTSKRISHSTPYNVHSIVKLPIPFDTIHIDCFGPLPTTEDEFLRISLWQ